MAPIRKRSEKISFRLEHKLSLKLEEAASVTKRNKSEVVRDAIEREVVRSLHAAETESVSQEVRSLPLDCAGGF
jgi:predicted transcriptional regulator